MQNIDVIPAHLLSALYSLFIDIQLIDIHLNNNLPLTQTRLSRLDYEIFCNKVILNPISGLSGTNFYAYFAGNSILAREVSTERAELGIKRQQEAAILQQLSTSGIAPKALAQTKNWLILEWLEETSCPQLTPEAFAELAITIHQQPLSGFQLDIKARFNLLFQYIDQARLTAKWQAIHNTFLRQDLPKTNLTVLAHMDLHPGNVIFADQRWRLIDWEYAADTDLFLEFAALFSGMNWQDKQKTQFLTAYHNYCVEHKLYALSDVTADLSYTLSAINAWQPWLNYLSFLWFEVRWRQTHDKKFIFSNPNNNFR